MPASNGGIVAPLNVEFVLPGFVLGNNFIYYYDPTNFNDANSGSNYSWKVEDILAGRTPTCNRVMVTYTDLGQVTANFTLQGTDDEGNVVSETETVQLGNAVATGKALTRILGLALTAQNLQLSVSRAAGAGPLSIVKVRMEGRIETTSYA